MVSNDRYLASSRTGLYVRMNAYRQRIASGRRAAASNSACQTGSMLGLSVILTRQWYHPGSGKQTQTPRIQAASTGSPT